LAASRVAIITPRPVGFARPSEPPSSIGLPVTTAVGVADVHRVGVHHPRHDLIVGVDVGRGDVLLGADRVDDLGDVAAGQRFELARDILVGSQMTPPLPPPNGMCATAHFHVIHARAP
jgi:hypothetical protein